MTKDGLPSTFKGCGSVITLAENAAHAEICAPNGDLYPRSGYRPLGDMRFIAANDPATVLRRCERDEKVLERHRPMPVSFVRGTRRVHETGCAYEWGQGDWDFVPINECPELLDLAAEFGITEGAEE